VNLPTHAQEWPLRRNSVNGERWPRLASSTALARIADGCGRASPRRA
jgi:hypothetical protein